MNPIVGIKMEIVIDDVLGDALVAKRDKVGDSLLEFVDLGYYGSTRKTVRR